MIARIVRPFLLLLLVTPLASLGGQIVRGTVTDRLSGQRVAGALVSLDRAGAAEAASVQNSALSDERGEFAIRAPNAGSYRVSVKRIGAQRITTDAFTLGDGETKRVDVALDAVLYRTPTITVQARALCQAQGEQGARLIALWDEVRTALLAVQISERDRLFSSRVYRYSRMLDAEQLSLLTEVRHEWEGLIERTFRTRDGEWLSKNGYWREERDTTLYHVPDAQALLSDAFVRDHCFRVVDGTGAQSGLVGLAFDVARSRRVPDVAGTLWLDARSQELRLIRFQYTRLPSSISSNFGGEVRFARMGNGAWIIRQWFIRMPRFAPPEARQHRFASETQASVASVFEDGGNAIVVGAGVSEALATLSGIVVDSAGLPMSGSAVRLLGSPLRDTTDAAGRFRFDSLQTAHYTIEVRHSAYDAVGLAAVKQPVDMGDGATRQVVLRAANTLEIAARYCLGQPPVPGVSATLRLTVVDSATREPVRRNPIWLYRVGPKAGEETLVSDPDAGTDDFGVSVMCALPLEVPFVIRVPSADSAGVAALPFRISRGVLWLPTMQVRARKAGSGS